MNYLFFKEVIKEYFGIFILIFVVFSFFMYNSFTPTNKEGICMSKPFSLNRGNSPGSIASGPNKGSASVNATIDGFTSVMDSMQLDVDMLKKFIPIKFSLGVVNNVDTSSNIEVTGNIPNIFVNFDIQNPPQGPTGLQGLNAPPVGETGPTGMTGPVGEPGYWGTTQNTLF
jgi:hypothetical protein